MLTYIRILFSHIFLSILHALAAFTTSTSSATTTSVTREVLRKMDPQQVATLLKSRAMDDDAIAVFKKHSISGKIIVDGLSDEDLKEMNFTSGIQRRAIKAILELIIANGWFCLYYGR